MALVIGQAAVSHLGVELSDASLPLGVASVCLIHGLIQATALTQLLSWLDSLAATD